MLLLYSNTIMSMILIHRLMILYMTLLMTFLLCHWNKTNVHRPIPDESHLQLHNLALISTTLMMMPVLKRTLHIMHQHMKQSQVLKLKSTQLTWCSVQDLCLFIIHCTALSMSCREARAALHSFTSD